MTINFYEEEKTMWDKLKDVLSGKKIENDSDDEMEFSNFGPAGQAKYKFNIIHAVTPENVGEERVKFFTSNFEYNPQFKYSNPAPKDVLDKFCHASEMYITQVRTKNWI